MANTIDGNINGLGETAEVRILKKVRVVTSKLLLPLLTEFNSRVCWVGSIAALLGYGPGSLIGSALTELRIYSSVRIKMSIDFQELTADQKLKAAAHNLLLDTSAEAFEFWDGAFRSQLFLDDRARALNGPCPGTADPENPSKAEKAEIGAWRDDCIYLFHKLTLATRMSHTATTIVASHSDSQDGRAAYQSLRDKCVGASSGDTIVSLISQLFQIDHFTGDNVDDVVNIHNRVSQRIKEFDLVKKDPVIFIDTMLKMHLLMLIQKNHEYGHVEEHCAQEDVTYEDTVRKINAKTTRLDHSIHKDSDPSSVNETGLYARPTRRMAGRRRLVCHYCKKPGHKEKNCYKKKQDAESSESGSGDEE